MGHEVPLVMEGPIALPLWPSNHNAKRRIKSSINELVRMKCSGRTEETAEKAYAGAVD